MSQKRISPAVAPGVVDKGLQPAGRRCPAVAGDLERLFEQMLLSNASFFQLDVGPRKRSLEGRAEG